MVDILDIPALGKLKIVEVYEYYDQPVLYSCQNVTGQFYFVVAAAEDDDYSTWLCTAVSTERFNDIRSGKTNLHDAFAHAENTYLTRVKVPYDQHASVGVDFIQSNQIPPNMLPMSSECLDLEIETPAELRDSEEIAKYGKREVLNLTLNFDSPFRSEAPVTVLSQILGNFQDVINAIGMHHFNLKRINQDIKRKMQMSFLKVGAGAFDIQLASTDTTDFSESSDCGDAIEKFLDLLAAGGNQKQLKSHLEELQSRVAEDYTAFLKSLNESVIDAKFKWVSPNLNRGRTVHLSDHQMREAIGVLKEYDKEISPPPSIKFPGYHLRSKRVQIETTDEPYKEIIAGQAIQIPKTTTSQLAISASRRNTIAS